jgi:hypothetical protein
VNGRTFIAAPLASTVTETPSAAAIVSPPAVETVSVHAARVGRT